MMETWVRINSSSTGKDKLFRLLQFTLKLLNHYIQKHAAPGEMRDSWKKLESSISFFRKTLRLGKSAEMLRLASRSIRLRDPVLRLTLTMSKIAQSLFLASDHLLWLSHSGLVRVDTARWLNIYYRCWLYSVVMRLARDGYELGGVLRDWRCSSALVHPGGSRLQLAAVVASRHRELLVDTAANLCDLLVPLASLGHLPLSPECVALCGMASSCLQIWTVVDPSMTLKPS